MITYIEIRTETGSMEKIEISEDVRNEAIKLPDAPDRYFQRDERSQMISVSSLILTRARVKGIKNAANLMLAAYEDRHPKRGAILVRALESGKYLVLDGNSTSIIAQIAGWAQVPCVIEGSDS